MIAAIAWVFEQEIKPSSVKFVLLALADCARPDGSVWPSITTIALKTSQDRKTVIGALDTLEGRGLLQDTGERCGSTKQVKVYRIVGLPNSEFHYTYKLCDADGNYYIGVRSCVWQPEDDTKYVGSGKFTAETKGEIRKEIIMKFATRPEAEAAEIRSIRAAAGDPKCQNVIRYQKRNSSVSATKEAQLRQETDPETGHGTINEPPVQPLEVKTAGQQKLFMDSDEAPVLANVEGFPEEWEHFRKHRKSLRAPMTERAEELIMDELAKRPNDIVAALRMAQKKGWKGFEWSWYDKELEREGKAAPKGTNYKKLTPDNAI